MDKFTLFEQEMLDRSRRIETRLTKIGLAQGVDMGGARPMWNNGQIDIPSRNCAIGDVMQVIPLSERNKAVPVYINGDYLGELNARG